jgi:hypothetical protein
MNRIALAGLDAVLHLDHAPGESFSNFLPAFAP